MPIPLHKVPFKNPYSNANVQFEYVFYMPLAVQFSAQGSVLGPLLFILYINDIPRLTQGKTFMYADNTTVMNIGHDINELQKITAANTGVVAQYFEINNLLINQSKTHHILYQTKYSRKESNLKILTKNSVIANVKSTNFLGVVIDNTLSWEDHVKKTCGRIS
jgi:hypothetical protein